MYLESRHCWGWESLNYIKLDGRDMKREEKKEREQVREQAVVSQTEPECGQKGKVKRRKLQGEAEKGSHPHRSLLPWVLSLSHTLVLFLLLHGPQPPAWGWCEMPSDSVSLAEINYKWRLWRF